jgi:hypothetical protein
MRTGVNVCGPDQLKVLQQVFDSLWHEMEREGIVDALDETMRDRVSRLVIDNADPDVLDVKRIKEAVLSSLARAA